MSESRADNRIYIGNLPPDIRNKDLEDLFYKYGKIRYIDLKNKRGPPFAFIEFDDALDAEDSIKGRDGYNYDGYRLRVEIQKGPRNSGPRSYGSRGGPPTRRSDYRCLISGLPPTGSWQDIKDHMRVAGNVCYADVFKDGSGVCEFIRYEDMKYAVKHLDDTKFRSHEGETSYISVRSDYSRRRSMSRSYSRSRSRSNSSRRRTNRAIEKERASPSYSPVRRSRSRSRSRSYDDRRVRRSYSRSRSRSRSPRRTKKYKSMSKSRSKSKSKSRSRSRSRSYSPKRRRTSSKSRSPSQKQFNESNGNSENNENNEAAAE